MSLRESTEIKKYLERDEVQLLALTESTLTKLGIMTDEEFGQLELYPDFRCLIPIPKKGANAPNFGIRLDSYFRFLLFPAKILRRLGKNPSWYDDICDDRRSPITKSGANAMIFVIKYPAYIEFLLQIWHNIFRKEVQSHLFSEWRAHMEIKRDIYLDKLIRKKKNGLIKVVTGVRRCGKSYLLFHLFHNHLLENGIPEDHIIEVALDDRRNKKLRDPDAILQFIDESIKDKEDYYIILDEVQYLDEFEDVLNSLLHIRNVDVYVTGSNSNSFPLM